MFAAGKKINDSSHAPIFVFAACTLFYMYLIVRVSRAQALNTALSWDQINSRPGGGGKKVRGGREQHLHLAERAHGVGCCAVP